MKNKKYNSDGEELFFYNGLWLPKRCIPTEEQKKNYYNRFTHPVLNWKKIIFLFVLFLLFIALLIVAFVILPIPILWKIITPIFIIILFCFIHLKPFSIFIIRLYQYFAPMRIREKCVFTPTCSDYMISAIKKYGFFKGIKKGYIRLKNCHGEYRNDPLD